MTKFTAVDGILILADFCAFFLLRESACRHAVLIAMFFGTMLVSLLVTSLAKDWLFRAVKALDADAYEKLERDSRTVRGNEVSIDRHYDYGAQVEELLEEYRFFFAIHVLALAAPLVLALASSI